MQRCKVTLCYIVICIAPLTEGYSEALSCSVTGMLVKRMIYKPRRYAQ